MLQLCLKHAPGSFVVYGTLLGAVREADIIPWDDDVDIAVPASCIAALQEAVESAGLRMTSFGRFYKVFDPDIPTVFLHRYSWPFVDVFTYTEDDAHVHITDIMGKMLSVPSSDVFPLSARGFGAGKSVPVPRHADAVLDATFGNGWATQHVSSSVNHRTGQRILRKSTRML